MINGGQIRRALFRKILKQEMRASSLKAECRTPCCLQTRSDHEALVLEIGTRIPGDAAHYSDVDTYAPPGGKPSTYTRRDGTPYSNIQRRARPFGS